MYAKKLKYPMAAAFAFGAVASVFSFNKSEVPAPGEWEVFNQAEIDDPDSYFNRTKEVPRSCHITFTEEVAVEKD